MERDVFAFYAGIMVGLLGNLLVSVTIEMIKAMQETNGLLQYWAIGFITSSIIFLQLTKWAMRKLGIAQRELRAFDITTITFILIGIYVIVWDKFLMA